MNLFVNSVINIYSLFVLTVVCVYYIKQGVNASLQNKLFFAMLHMTNAILVFDTLSRFDGGTGSIKAIYRILNETGNFMLFLLAPVIPSLWLLYVHVCIYKEKAKVRQLTYMLTALCAVHAIIFLLLCRTGLFYMIGEDNIYRRGPLFLLYTVPSQLLLISVMLFIIIERHRIGKRNFRALLLFSLFPIISVFLQSFIYNISFVPNAAALSLFIIFMHNQTRNGHIDYLTGMNNRCMFEMYLRKKVRGCRKGRAFSAIMLDLDNFKYINDTYGHDTGDEALQNFAGLLRSCLRPDDFTARYGGDEFYVIIDTADTTVLREIAGRIIKSVDEFNKTGSHPYKIYVSMGYAVYDCGSHMTAINFKKLLDRLMYENKNGKAE